MLSYHLAQINVGRLVAPLDDPQIAGFIAQLDTINRLAEASPGFIWRLQSEKGNATDVPYNEDPFMIVNMSVWESVESLKAFTYRTQHIKVFRERGNWFQEMDVAHYCLWWVPADHRPSVAEGKARLEAYQRHGSTAESFWFSELHPAPLAELAPA